MPCTNMKGAPTGIESETHSAPPPKTVRIIEPLLCGIELECAEAVSCLDSPARCAGWPDPGWPDPGWPDPDPGSPDPG